MNIMSMNKKKNRGLIDTQKKNGYLIYRDLHIKK